MGSACMGRSIKAPEELIGSWILNEQSRDFEVHSSPIRQSYGLNNFQNSKSQLKKLIINRNGFIVYQQSEKGNVFRIEGYVIRWGHNQIQTANGSIVEVDYKKANEGYIIVQSGKLYKA